LCASSTAIKVHNDLRVVTRELLGACGTNASTTSGHDDHFIFQGASKFTHR
jgi:hypothetical protein